MHVTLVDYASGEARVLGTVRAFNGEVIIEGEVSAQMRDTIMIERARVDVDDGTFLRRLSRRFAGRHVRAHFVE